MPAKSLRDVLMLHALGYLALGGVASGVYGILYWLQIVHPGQGTTWWDVIAILAFGGIAVGVLKFLAILQNREFDGSVWKTFVCPHCSKELELAAVPADPKASYPCPYCSQTVAGKSA